MSNTVKFKCPYCGGEAQFYRDTGQALCPRGGLLLYTDIPAEVANQRKSKWASIEVDEDKVREIFRRWLP